MSFTLCVKSVKICLTKIKIQGGKMGKRIDLESYINKKFTPKSEHEYIIEKYLFKEKTNHMFQIKFTETGNTQDVSLNQIRNGTVIDLVQRKKIKRIQTQNKLKERTRLVKNNKFSYNWSNLDGKRILALDLSTTATGIAYALEGQIKRSALILPTESDNYIKRSNDIMDALEKIIKTGKIDVVIIEDIYLGLNSDILMKLSELRGMFKRICKGYNIEIIEYPATIWKNHFSFMPVYRNDQKLFTINYFEMFEGKSPASDDEADAYCMLKSVLDKMQGLEKDDTRVMI